MNLGHPSDTKKSNYQSAKPVYHGRIIVKLLCVFAAFFLWIYVMMVESPEHTEVFNNITVDLINRESLAENGLAVYSGLGTTVDVTLSGKKSTLSKLTAEDIIVSADMSEITSGGGRYERRITVDVPSGCQLVELSRETVSVYIDEEDELTLDLEVQLENTKLPDGIIMESTDIPTTKIDIRGAKGYVEYIEQAVAVFDLTGITKTTTLTAKITLFDKHGVKIENRYIDYSPKEITIEIPISKQVEVPIELTFKHGYLSENNADISIVPNSVFVMGDPEIIDAGSLIAPIEIDEKLDLDDGEYTRTVYLNEVDGVELSTNAVEVSVIVHDTIETREITVLGTNIEDTGGKSGVEYTWEKNPVTVTIMGPLEDIAKINPDDITLQLDMSPYTNTNTGTIRVRADVIIDSPYAENVIELGVYSVNVTFLN